MKTNSQARRNQIVFDSRSASGKHISKNNHGSNPRHRLGNPTLRTLQTTKPIIFNPLSQRQRRLTMSFVLLLMVLLLPFRVRRAAMLTQPPVTEVEEVGGLVHENLLRG